MSKITPTTTEILTALKESRDHWQENYDKARSGKLLRGDITSGRCALCALFAPRNKLDHGGCILYNGGGCCTEWHAVSVAINDGSDVITPTSAMLAKIDRLVVEYERRVVGESQKPCRAPQSAHKDDTDLSIILSALTKLPSVQPEFHVGDLVWWDGVRTFVGGETSTYEPSIQTIEKVGNRGDECEYYFVQPLLSNTGWTSHKHIRHLTDDEWTVTINVDGKDERVRFYEYNDSGYILYVDATSVIGPDGIYSFKGLPCDVLARSIIRTHYPVMPWSMVKRLYGSIDNVPRPK